MQLAARANSRGALVTNRPAASIRSVERLAITWGEDLVPERGVSCAAGGKTPSVRGKSRQIRTSTFWMFWLAAMFALMTGCASDRVRCNGKLEPINTAAVVPAVNLGAAESEQIRRSESQ